MPRCLTKKYLLGPTPASPSQRTTVLACNLLDDVSGERALLQKLVASGRRSGYKSGHDVKEVFQVSPKRALHRLQDDVAGPCYFIYVPDRRKKLKPNRLGSNNLCAYKEVASALKERGMMLRNIKVGFRDEFVGTMIVLIYLFSLLSDRN